MSWPGDTSLLSNASLPRLASVRLIGGRVFDAGKNPASMAALRSTLDRKSSAVAGAVMKYKAIRQLVTNLMDFDDGVQSLRVLLSGP